MFYIQFFLRNRLRRVSDMSEASKSCSSTSTSTRPSTTSGYIIFSKTYMVHFIFNFSREIDWEWPRYIRGLPSHIFKNTHIVHVSCQFFKRNQLVMVRYVRGPPSHAHRRRQCQPGQVPQVGMTNSQKLTWHMF